MATFKAVLKHEPAKDGSHAVRIRVHTPGSTRFYDTGLRLPKTFWEPKAKEHLQNWVRTRFKDQEDFNATIAADLKALRDIALQDRGLDAEGIIAAYKATYQPEVKAEKGFIAFCRSWIARKHSLGQAGTATLYQTALNRFTEYAGPEPQESQLLTAKGAAAFLSWLLNTRRKKNPEQPRFEPSTVAKTISLLNTMHANAQAEGWLPVGANPFDNSTVTVPEKQKERPTEAQVMAFMAMELTGSRLHARNAFLLQFFIRGARISEALTLRWPDVKKDHLAYYPKKRGRKLKIVPRHPALDHILSQYPKGKGPVLPYLSEADLALPEAELLNRIKAETWIINYSLALIGKQAGLPFKLTTHMSRHAFTDVLLAVTNDMREVQAQLGHATLQTTERYARNLLQGQLDETTNKAFSKFVVPTEKLGQH